MICPLLILPVACFIGPGPVAVDYGYASQYAESPTVHTLQARLDWGHLTVADVSWAAAFVAVADCGRIGDRMLLGIDGAWLNAVVFDCAGHVETVRWMEDNRILVEIDYWTVDRMGLGCYCGHPVTVMWLN